MFGQTRHLWVIIRSRPTSKFFLTLGTASCDMQLPKKTPQAQRWPAISHESSYGLSSHTKRLTWLLISHQGSKRLSSHMQAYTWPIMSPLGLGLHEGFGLLQKLMMQLCGFGNIHHNSTVPVVVNGTLIGKLIPSDHVLKRLLGNSSSGGKASNLDS